MKELNTQIFQNKLRNKFFKLGVKMTGPETIFFSKDTKIGKNVTIEPYVVIGAKVKKKSIDLTRTIQTEVKNYKRKKK